MSKEPRRGIINRRHCIAAFCRIALVGALALSGCTVLPLQLHDDDLKLLQINPKVYVVTFKSPPFGVDTSTNYALVGSLLGAAGGAQAGSAAAGAAGRPIGTLIGGIAGAEGTSAAVNAIGEANISADIQSDPRALVKSVAYEDPVKQVRDEFLGALKGALKMSNFTMVEEPLEDESLNALSEKFSEGIVLAFKTEEWVLTIVPLSSDFFIKYRVQGMFYLPQEKRIIWRELCGFTPRESTASLSELAANSGQGIKERLTDTGRRCAKQLAAELIELTSGRSRREDR